MTDDQNDRQDSNQDDITARRATGWKRGQGLRITGLDPAGEPKGSVFSTLYVADELLIHPRKVEELAEKTGDPGISVDRTIAYLTHLAGQAGWAIDLEVPLSDAPSPSEVDQTEPYVGPARTLRLRVEVAPEEVQQGQKPTGDRRPAATPDAWELLRQARADGMSVGVSLNHAIAAGPFTANPFTANPFTANPFTANPFTANPFTANPFTANAVAVGIGSYAAVGFGGRQPVAFVGAAPEQPDEGGPVVAVFDTGLGTHDWLTGPAVIEDAPALGIGRYDRGPDVYPEAAEPPYDGVIDVASGHGTFIAGIIRQRCPRARILPVWIAHSDGLITENELIAALSRLIDYMDRDQRVDVLNLSFGFFHEASGVDDLGTISEMEDLLTGLRSQRGCVIVCSAGNEATDRPALPASLAGPEALQVTVGALNPSARSVALFSNIGEKVDVYVPGVSIVSTFPESFEGSIRAGMKDDLHHLHRTTLDIDDFRGGLDVAGGFGARGGFGVWSGTSFAAPVVAAEIAKRIVLKRTAQEAVDETVKQLTHVDDEDEQDKVGVMYRTQT